MRTSYTDQDMNFSGSGNTLKALQTLIIITCVVTLGTALFEPIFTKFIGGNGPLYYFGLSVLAYYKLYIWQIATYFFLLQGFSGVNVLTFVNLAIAMYLLWTFGSEIISRYGSLSFLRFYLLTGFISGAISLIWMLALGNSGILIGNTACLFALFIVWSMLHPDSEILLFFVIPCKTKWLVAGILGGAALIFLSEGNGLSFLQVITGTVLGYLWGTIGWQLYSPYSFTTSLDEKLGNLGVCMTDFSRSKPKDKPSSKIVNIQTGNQVEKQDDQEEQFVDEMLAKISKEGEQSLTSKERERLDLIAAKKKKKES